jgi:hypothetical protein
MTLKEKFKKQLDTATPTLNRPFYQSEKCEAIADDFAIDFGEYLDSLTTEDMGILSVKELLEIYKKEKGL